MLRSHKQNSDLALGAYAEDPTDRLAEAGLAADPLRYEHFVTSKEERRTFQAPSGQNLAPEYKQEF